MGNRSMLAVMVGVAVLWAPSGAGAITPAEKCESSELKTSGKYAFCRLKADAKAVTTGGMADYSKCDEKFASKFGQADTQGMGQCPSSASQAQIQTFITQCSDDVATALAGGPLPDCAGNLATCTTAVNSCTATLGACNAGYATCTSDLGTCSTNLTATTASLTTCNGNLSTCSSDLGTCNTTLGTCNTSLSSCTSSLTTVNAGTATQGDVLSGTTFSSGAGIGLSGTMANNGAVAFTPGTSVQAIAAGYHNGSGTVAGDPDLTAANIKNGVNIFGVTGTASGGAVSRTGQTTAYGPGSDGDLQTGSARSFTDNGDGTITDNLTGLMWEKKSDDGSIHDKDNEYTWGLNVSPYSMNGTMVTTFLAGLNGGGGFAGHTDWRIPNRFELESLVNLQSMNPAVSSAFNTSCAATCTVTTCSCTKSGFTLSSSTYLEGPDFAWGVDFGGGHVSASGKNSNNYVRAVRGGS